MSSSPAVSERGRGVLCTLPSHTETPPAAHSSAASPAQSAAKELCEQQLSRHGPELVAPGNRALADAGGQCAGRGGSFCPPGSAGRCAEAAWRLSTPGSAQWTRLNHRPQRGNPQATGPLPPARCGSGAPTVPLVSSSSMVVWALSEDSWGDAGSSGSEAASAPHGAWRSGAQDLPSLPEAHSHAAASCGPRGHPSPRFGCPLPHSRGPCVLGGPTATWLLDILRLLVKWEGTHSPCIWADGAGGFQQVVRSLAGQTAAPATAQGALPAPPGPSPSTRAWPRLSSGLGRPRRSPSTKHPTRGLLPHPPVTWSPGSLFAP